MWISTAQRADKILLLARTSKSKKIAIASGDRLYNPVPRDFLLAPLEEVKKPTHGLSIFYTDFDRTKVEVKEIDKVRVTNNLCRIS
jgi:acyl-CoA dehydrogenase